MALRLAGVRQMPGCLEALAARVSAAPILRFLMAKSQVPNHGVFFGPLNPKPLILNLKTSKTRRGSLRPKECWVHRDTYWGIYYIGVYIGVT